MAWESGLDEDGRREAAELWRRRRRGPGLLEWFEDRQRGMDGDALDGAGPPSGFAADDGWAEPPATPLRGLADGSPAGDNEAPRADAPPKEGLLQRYRRAALQGPLYDLVVPGAPAKPWPSDAPLRGDDAEEDVLFDRPPVAPAMDDRGGGDFPAPATGPAMAGNDSRRGLAKAPMPGGPAPEVPEKSADERPGERQEAFLQIPFLFGGAAAGGGLTAAEIAALLGLSGLLGLGAKTYLEGQKSGPQPAPPRQFRVPVGHGMTMTFGGQAPPVPAETARPPLEEDEQRRSPAIAAQALDRRMRPNGPRNEAERRLWDFVDGVLGDLYPSEADESGGRRKGRKGEGKDKGENEPSASGESPGPQPPRSPLSVLEVATEAYQRGLRQTLDRRERKRQIEAGDVQEAPPRHTYGPRGNLKTQAAVDTFNRIFIDVGREFGVDFPASLRHMGGGRDITQSPRHALPELFLKNPLRQPGDSPLQGSNRMDSALKLYGYLFAYINLQRIGKRADEADQLARATVNGIEGFAYGILKQVPDEDDPAFARRLTQAARGIFRGLTEFHEELVQRLGRDPSTLDRGELQRIIWEKKNELWEKYGRYSSPGAPGGILPAQPRRPSR